MANCARPFGPITKPDKAAAAAPVSLVNVMAPASTVIEVPEKLAAGSKVSVSELSSVKDWPPLSTAPAPTVSSPGAAVVDRPVRLKLIAPPLDTRTSAPLPSIVTLLARELRLPLAAMALPPSMRRPFAAFGSAAVEAVVVTRMISGPVSGSLASFETTTLLAIASMVMPLVVCVRVPPINRLPAPSASRLSAEICR